MGGRRLISCGKTIFSRVIDVSVSVSLSCDLGNLTSNVEPVSKFTFDGQGATHHEAELSADRESESGATVVF